MFKHTVNNTVFVFNSLAELMAKATPLRSGDQLAGIAAQSYQERVAAQMALAHLPISEFLNNPLIPYEIDEITRLIFDTHDKEGFKNIAHLTVGDFRNYLLDNKIQKKELTALQKAITPEIAAAVSKIMSLQDLILVSSKCEVITKFRSTVGLKGHLSTRLQPNHPTDDVKGILASVIDGLFYGNGDALIGINPAFDNITTQINLLKMLDDMRLQYQIPTQMCVLSHITNTIMAIEQGAPVDLVFQSIGGTEKTNASFGINLALLKEGYEAAQSLSRGTIGTNVMYFETGQGSSLSSNSHYGIDQQTLEARSYAVARAFDPFLVNSVVGFIGPEYLYDGKQIIRAGLEDHFCAKIMGLPMGCDVCYTNHAEADQDDMDVLLTLLGTAGCNFIMGIPGSDDIMLNYQSTSFHDALYIRKLLGLKPAPEFEEWLINMGIMNHKNELLLSQNQNKLLELIKR
ncbi:ethanolamine ammonia-lyase subunit EutB [Flavobacterium sp. Arc3]|jgi:ethanolamine ammonia-lyase large subunit|uniref:ethanolamine ammonia-lyase subunit EutB n=1 Tax=unclassified Flavobacterium TaxID=196869 RepID=UPI00352BE1CE